MISFNPYITFDGRCEEALHFYKQCFGGEIVFIQYYRESKADIPATLRDKIMHSEFAAGNIRFMACDAMPGQSLDCGTNITFQISFDSPQQQQETFDKLARGGSIQMPLQETFWKSRFGMLTDPYGIHWLLNYHNTTQ